MVFIVFAAFVVMIVLFAACTEFYWLRKTVRARADGTRCELRTIEKTLAEHRVILNGLKSGCEASDAAYAAVLQAIQKDLADLKNSEKQWYGNMSDSHHARIQTILQCFEDQNDILDKISKAVCLPADTAPDPDSQISKAMEEGIMNLMNYAAGKAGTGIEVGLG